MNWSVSLRYIIVPFYYYCITVLSEDKELLACGWFHETHFIVSLGFLFVEMFNYDNSVNRLLVWSLCIFLKATSEILFD